MHVSFLNRRCFLTSNHLFLVLLLTPEDSGLSDVAEDIVESDVTCTDEEKATLTASVTSFDALIVEAEAALEAIQKALEDFVILTIQRIIIIIISLLVTGKINHFLRAHMHTTAQKYMHVKCEMIKYEIKIKINQ